MADGVATGGAGQRAITLVTQVKRQWVGLPAERRKGLTIAALLLLSVAAGLAWYGGRTDWRPLFSGLETKDVQQVAQELGAAGIPFQMSSDGTGVEVPAEMVDKARMEVAAKGMPQTGRLGFELFDKPNWVGSEFDEKVNYQRALEGELEHTIGTLGVVRSARVHLVLPQQTLFATEEKAAKASVVLKLKRASLSPEQTESIRNLVAGAVENLSPEQVTLVDAEGRADLDAHHGTGGAEAEQAMETRLVAMLEPLAGVGNVRATVNVSYDEGREERTDEVFDPTLSAPQTMQRSQQTNGSATHAGGVPGTASNTPAAAPVGAVQGSEAAAAPGVPPLLKQKDALPVFPGSPAGAQSTSTESGTYAVTRHLLHTESGPGRIRRVTAAVVVNDRLAVESAGKLEHAVWKPRTAEEMHRLEELAQAAVGFDTRRGDQVVMENVSFSSNAPEVKLIGVDKVVEEAKGLLQSQTGLLRNGVMGLLGLLVILFILRPVATQVVTTLQTPLLFEAQQRAVVEDLGPEDPATLVPVARAQPRVEAGESERRLGDKRGRVFDQVAEHVRREPTESTRLLAAWIGSEEEAS